jgi:hypothetical protein
MIKHWMALLPISLAVSAVLGRPHSIAHAATVRTVALSAQPVPGALAGVTYTAFQLPTLNDAGQTAFLATIAGNSVDYTNGTGIWSEASRSLAVVARGASPAPGTPGINFRGFGKVGLNSGGEHVFYADLAGATQYNEQGIWSDGLGGLALIARQGNPAVGTPNGVYYSDLSGDSLVWSATARAAFTADLQRDGFPWGSGLWEGSVGNLRAVALSGNEAPGAPSGIVFDVLGGFETMVLNDAGRTAFVATISGSGVAYRVNDRGVWSEGKGSLALVARAGSHAPGTASGVSFGAEWFPLSLNNDGQIAFAATLAGSGVNAMNDTGLWSNGSGALELVARGGSQAPGAASGVSFSGFYGAFPLLNNAGQIAVLADLTGSGVDSTNDGGIWLGPAASLQLVAREGTQAPGTTSGVNFLDLTEPALNDAGQIAFVGLLTGSSVDETNSIGIWATDATGALQLVARHGDLLEVAPSDFRTIDSLTTVVRNGSSDGRPGGFNNLGQVAYWASFTDGSEGIFVSDIVAIPEPGSLALLALAVPLIIWLKSRGQSSNSGGEYPRPTATRTLAVT